MALGLSVGDISSLVALGKYVGNWWTASSGDEEFLSMLNEDEFNILKRRGLIDMTSFNKRWSIAGRALLVNSLLGKCSSPSEIAKFTLVDVDVGGIPRDSEGIIRSGEPDLLENQQLVSSPTPAVGPIEVTESRPDEDVSLHIEPD